MGEVWAIQLSASSSDIDSEPFDSELELLQHRAWALHWSLFVHLNRDNKSLDEIVDTFLSQQPYLNTIQVSTMAAPPLRFDCRR